MLDLGHLNDEQRRAVTAPLERPVLLIAGAGSGKTTVVAHRVAFMVDQGIAGEKVVAMTFTRRAAEELRERFGSLGVGGVDTVWAGTMHSFAYHRLKAHLAPDPAWTVISNPKRHIRRLRGRPDEEYREALDSMPEIDLAQVIGRIGRWQDELVSPAEALEVTAGGGDRLEIWTARMYDAYTRWKLRTNHLDFGDMLFRLVDVYDSDPEIALADRRLFPHCLVDELQDTNTAQWRLLEQVWSQTPLFGVGDPRQAIYQWRGARPDQLIGFGRLWPDAVRLTLDRNYRCREAILAPAQLLIDHAPEAERIEERMVAVRPGGEAPIVTDCVARLVGEASHVAGAVTSLLAGGVEPGEIAVLYRTNAQSVDFEDELAASQIPYQVVGSSGFWGRREVLDMLAYLRLVVDPEDVDSFSRAIKAPSRYLGAAFIQACIRLSAGKNISLVAACSAVTSTNGRMLNRGQLDEASYFSSLIASMNPLSAPGPAISTILRTTDYRSWLLKEEGSADSADDDRMETLEKLVEAASRFATIGELLTHAEKQASKSSAGAKRDPDRVQLLTIHRAKGLEWRAVFVAGMADGLLPHHRAPKTEERRLAYVAMTRAKDRLELTVPVATVRGPADPSPFLAEAGLGTEMLVEVAS